MVPASFHERRWATFDISEDIIQEQAILRRDRSEEMNPGSREALLHHLLQLRLLSQVDIRTIPKTAALLARTDRCPILPE